MNTTIDQLVKDLASAIAHEAGAHGKDENHATRAALAVLTAAIQSAHAAARGTVTDETWCDRMRVPGSRC